MCRTLGLSTSGYCDSLDRPPWDRSAENAALNREPWAYSKIELDGEEM
jgi:hypothetical protein